MTTFTLTRNPIVANASEYRGSMRLDIRHHYEDKSGQLQPTQKGVNIALEDFQALAEAYTQALQSAPNPIQANCKHRNPVMVRISEYKGAARVDIRHYYYDETGELQPTQKGVSLPLEHSGLFLDLLCEAANTSIAVSAPSRFSLVET